MTHTTEPPQPEPETQPEPERATRDSPAAQSRSVSAVTRRYERAAKLLPLTTR